MKRIFALISGVLLLGGCASAVLDEYPAAWNDPGLNSVTESEFVFFENNRELNMYMSRLHRLAKDRDAYWALLGHKQYAQAAPEECVGEECEEDQIVVTGSRIKSSSSKSITNNQKAGVDEGDIVKNFGRFLIVLQDGRLFSVDTGHAPRDMKLVDRIDVYADEDTGGWYDEMLIYKNRIVVTGYSYEMEASELSVLSISPEGIFTHEATFFLSSDDYYDIENYASRLVNGNLVLHTPLNLAESYERGEPIVFPSIRKWTREGGLSKPRRLYEAADVYKPVQKTLYPTMHAISVCPIRGKTLNCKTTAVIAPSRAEYYVDDDNAYLWVGYGWDDVELDDCDEIDDNIENTWQNYKGLGAGVYQFSIRKAGYENSLKAVFTQGMPSDQFALETSEGHFRALLNWSANTCEIHVDGTTKKYVDFTLGEFSARPRAISDDKYVTMPSLEGSSAENMFTADYLIFGDRKGWGIKPPHENAKQIQHYAVAVPVKNPHAVVKLPLPHNVIRLESIGDNVVITGYKDDKGLSLSSLDLRAAPRIADTVTFAGRYESEGRSHAFNSDVNADGSGIFGIPTVKREKTKYRWYSYSDTSDLSFMTFNTNLRMTDAGQLKASDDPVDPDYDCEVSCIDWYGNTRPIFIGGRTFALSATELIEGRLVGGQMRELARVNLSSKPENIRKIEEIVQLD